MKKLMISAVGAAFLTLPVAAAAVEMASGFALTAGGTRIVSIENLGNTSSTVGLDLTGGQIDAITYRPFTGELLGYSVGRNGDTDKIYEINTSTGALTLAPAAFQPSVSIAAGSQIDFDFNTNLDAARVVSTANDNLVYFPPDTGSGSTGAGNVVRATNLAYAAGDVNIDVEPSVFANAYTNAVDGEISSTTDQFALDAQTNALVTLANNAGTLVTISKVTLFGSELDFSTVGALDIISEEQGDNLAIALLNVESATGSESGLYTIDLTSGNARFLGGLGDQEYIGFAAQVRANTVNVSAVPLPVPALMLLSALFGLVALHKKRPV